MSTIRAISNDQLAIKTISVDTLFRDDYDNTISTDFIYVLPETIHKVVSVRISAMELPNVWYSFSSLDGTNTFKITIYNFYEQDASYNVVFVMSREFDIVIPSGNYTSVNFENTLNNYFVNNGQGLQYLFCNVDQTTTCTIIRAVHVTDGGATPDPFDSTSQYYSPEFYFTLDFTNGNTGPLYKKTGWMLGFKKGFYTVTHDCSYVATTVFNTNNLIIKYYAYLQSESSYGSSVYPYVYLDIDEYRKNLRLDNLYTFVGNTNAFNINNILARISISSSQNTIIIDNGSDQIFKKRDYIGPVKIEKLHIRLLNRFGDVVHLNLNDFSFIIEFTAIQSSS